MPTLGFSHSHDVPQRTARVARSYWRCSECGANHTLDVQQCTDCGGPDAYKPLPRRPPGMRHWAMLVATWAAATVLWAVASGVFAGRA